MSKKLLNYWRSKNSHKKLLADVDVTAQLYKDFSGKDKAFSDRFLKPFEEEAPELKVFQDQLNIQELLLTWRVWGVENSLQHIISWNLMLCLQVLIRCGERKFIQLWLLEIRSYWRSNVVQPRLEWRRLVFQLLQMPSLQSENRDSGLYSLVLWVLKVRRKIENWDYILWFRKCFMICG